MKPLLVALVVALGCGPGREENVSNSQDLATPSGLKGQLRAKWTIDGQGTTCPDSSDEWRVSIDGVEVGSAIICFSGDPWTTGIVMTPFGQHSVTVKLTANFNGPVLGTKTAMGTVSSNDPNTIVEVNIPFTEADF